jgi:hypothetical protein
MFLLTGKFTLCRSCIVSGNEHQNVIDVITKFVVYLLQKLTEMSKYKQADTNERDESETRFLYQKNGSVKLNKKYIFFF